MRLSAPTKLVFWISVVLVVLALISFFDIFLGGYGFWLAFAGYVLLALGNLLKGF